jgi:hypothetical protein
MQLVNHAIISCVSVDAGNGLPSIPVAWLHGRGEGGEDLLPQLGWREITVRGREGDAPFLGLGRQQVHAVLPPIAAVASALVEVPDLDAVALREAQDDRHVVGLAVAFQDSMRRIDAMNVQLVGLGYFYEGLAQLRVDETEGFVDALSLDP